jgi:hypothetical protein
MVRSTEQEIITIRKMAWWMYFVFMYENEAMKPAEIIL